MFPLVSRTNNYHLLLLEEKKKCYTPAVISPIITNEIDLRSKVRDVGFVIPVETVTFNQIGAAPSLDFAFDDAASTSILSGNYATMLNVCQQPLSRTEESEMLQSIIDDQFFPSRPKYSSSALPIFLYDGK
jgi:hypothetical protein